MAEQTCFTGESQAENALTHQQAGFDRAAQEYDQAAREAVSCCSCTGQIHLQGGNAGNDGCSRTTCRAILAFSSSQSIGRDEHRVSQAMHWKSSEENLLSEASAELQRLHKGIPSQTQECAWQFPKQKPPTKIVAFTDADWASNEDGRRSTDTVHLFF